MARRHRSSQVNGRHDAVCRLLFHLHMQSNKSDASLWATALRETHEELGIAPEQVERLGELGEPEVSLGGLLVHGFVVSSTSGCDDATGSMQLMRWLHRTMGRALFILQTRVGRQRPPLPPMPHRLGRHTPSKRSSSHGTKSSMSCLCHCRTSCAKSSCRVRERPARKWTPT